MIYIYIHTYSIHIYIIIGKVIHYNVILNMIVNISVDMMLNMMLDIFVGVLFSRMGTLRE